MSAIKPALLLLLFLVTTPLQSLATSQKVYVYKDENGNTVFSDKPRPGAKEVKLNTKPLTMPTTDTDILRQLQSQDEVKQVKYQVTVNQPAAQATIRNNSGRVDVSGRVSPQMQSGQKLQLKLDGQIRQKPHANGRFVLRNVNRGEHQIVLELIDGTGKVLASSEPATFYLFRASILHNQ